MNTIACDIAIIGGSLGGWAALTSIPNVVDAGDWSPSVVLIHNADWIGGQMTSQGVSALDEHQYIETSGCVSKRFSAIRDAIRYWYEYHHDAPTIMQDSVLGANMPLNPGNGWVSRLCFLPEYGHEVLLDDFWHRQGWSQGKIISITTDENEYKRIVIERANQEKQEIVARYYVLDATDTGDLLALAGLDYVTGAESQADTGEPHAPPDARPRETQGFTYCFAVEYCAGENHTIDKPDGYEYFRDNQPYTLSPSGRDGQPVVYKMFETSEQGNLPFWTYRRIHDGALLGGNDIALMNWVSNDYHGGDILNATPDEKAQYLDEATRLSLGFLYWLQTECPRDDGGYGYPELKLRPDIMGTSDGLSQMPYIRESRRIKAMTRIVEQDITAEYNHGARAKHFSDSVGIGWYAMDLHPCVGNPDVSMYAPTKPFQIPLGALIPQQETRVIPACKNIGTTHLTNGAYRVHPSEWAIGEAAGMLASFCVVNDVTPHAVLASAWLTWRLQYHLLKVGCPIMWVIDVPLDSPYFMATQLLLVRDIIIEDSPRWHTLEIGLHQPLSDSIDIDKVQAIAQELNTHNPTQMIALDKITRTMTWAQLCDLFIPAIEVLQ